MPKAPKTTAGAKAKRTTATKDAAKPAKGKNASSKAPEKAQAPRGRGRPSKAEAEDEDEDDGEPTSMGFKDVKTAQFTIDSLKDRSLTAQRTHINAYMQRAKTHANPTKGMKAAVAVFEKWLKVDYPAARGELRASGFKPMVPKDTVAKLSATFDAEGVGGLAREFADFYPALKSRARLSAQLVDPDDIDQGDWETVRYEQLAKLLPPGKEDPRTWGAGELWDDEGAPTREHLELLAWAWSPLPMRTVIHKIDAFLAEEEGEEA
ncbi:Uu.00g027800.m01.CDS01 [Anthostomella pinea]|uniref:Uu.00g027800.m01.CDS01 n=1 Tax=Anthostomella pinea TaxID=933095 RepID=A0AAI8V8A9_9PEZI|nr:Uu.00g027800.m01.CDS01 [Anthostomella pinea]